MAEPTVARQQPLWLTAIFSVLIFLALYVDFQPLNFRPVMTGLDESWSAALAYGAEKGWLFGTDIVFTGGPLSSLFTRQFQAQTVLPLAAVSVLLIFFLSFVLTSMLSRVQSVLDMVLVWLILLICMLARDTIFLSVPFLTAIYGLSDPSRSRYVSGAVGAFLSGLLSLAKFSIFPLSLLAMLVLDVIALRRRRLPIHTAMLAVGIVLGFVVGGQPIGQLPAFFVSSIEVSSGYSSAMSSPSHVRDLLAWLLLVGILMVLLLAKLAQNWRSQSIDVSVSIVLVVAGFLFIGFKGGLVRHDLHTLISWSVLVVAALAVRLLPGEEGGRVQNMLMLVAAVSIVPAYIFFVFTGNQKLTPQIVAPTPKEIINQVQLLAKIVTGPSGWIEEKKAENEASMQKIRQRSPMPRLDGTVDIIHYEQSAVIASGLDYAPRPTIQEYATYTPKLIARNKAFFESAKAPEYLIFAPGSIDRRHPASAEGALWPLFFSRYEPFGEEFGKLVLRKRQAPLTGLLGPSTIVETGFSQKVAVPSTGNPMMVSIRMKPTLIGRLMDLAFRPPLTQIVVTYDDSTEGVYRLIPGMASEGFLLSPLVETTDEYILASSGYSDSIGFKNAKSFSIRSGIGADLVYEPSMEVTFTPINAGLLRDAAGSSLVTELLERLDRLKPLLSANQMNGSTIARVPEGILAHAPMTLRLPLDQAGSLVVTFGMRPGSWENSNGATGGACFIVRDETGVLLKQCLDPANVAADRGTQERTISVATGPTELKLETTCEKDCTYDWTYWGGVKLRPGEMTEDQLAPLLSSNALNGKTIIRIPEGLLAHAPATLRLPVGNARLLDVTFGMRPGSWGNSDGTTGGACFIVRDGVQVLMNQCLDPSNVASDRNIQEKSISIDEGVTELTLETTCGKDCIYDWTFWGGVKLQK